MNNTNRTEVYYWSGGREVGEWRKANLSARYACRELPQQPSPFELTPEECIAELGREGYVALAVNPNIGPPDDAPADWRFRRLGL